MNEKIIRVGIFDRSFAENGLRSGTAIHTGGGIIRLLKR